MYNSKEIGNILKLDKKPGSFYKQVQRWGQKVSQILA